MATIPDSVTREYLEGLPLLWRGKVRDTYGGLIDELGILENLFNKKEHYEVDAI